MIRVNETPYTNNYIATHSKDTQYTLKYMYVQENFNCYTYILFPVDVEDVAPRQLN